MTSSIIYGAAAAFLSAAPAWAQTEPSETTAATEAGTDEKGIVVTGSRIPQPNLDSVSPIVSLGQEEVKARGVVRIEDLINTLPQASPDFGANINFLSTGIATVNLRGLGASRTLVLVDGKRLMPGNPTPAGNVPDLNFIPAPLVERVEVLTGGASAVYGADAVAGVVNFIMLKDFSGVRLDAQTSFYQHNNNNDEIQALVREREALSPGQFPLPDGSVTDGTAHSLSAVVGANTGDGRGNVTLYATYLKVDAIDQGQRDYSVCQFASGPALTCALGGTSTTSRLRIGPAFAPTFFVVDPGTGNFRPLDAQRDIYNSLPLRLFQRPDTRYTFGAMGHYEISEAADVYGQVMMMDDRSFYQLEPTNLAIAMPFNCDSPLLTAQQAATVCGANAGLPVARGGVLFQRLLAVGNRRQRWRHTSYRLVGGVRGDFADAWHYDVYGQYGTTIYKQRFENDVSVSRITRALDVVRDANGNAVCRSALLGTDTNCVPYNPFALTVDPAALDYVRTDGVQEGDTQEKILSGSITGDLGHYGIRMPWAEDGVGVALGAEYRREDLNLRPDDAFRTGDVFNFQFPNDPQSAGFSVKEVFGELRIPIVEDQSWTDRLALELGYRYSDYSTGFTTHTYKIGGDWAPVRDVRFRAAYQRAVRAPNIWDLFSPQIVVFDGSSDPCAGTAPTATAAQCALTGVTAAQYGNIETAPPPFFYNGLIGGNPDLNAEKADSYTLGAVFTPRFLPGFSLSLDWYDIKVRGALGNYGADNILNNCITTGDAFWCDKINRGPNGALFGQGPLAGFVEDLTANVGRVNASGVDVEANYRFNLADVGLSNSGSLGFNLVGSWTRHYGSNALAESPNVECAGFFGATCGTPNPKWRHKARVTWTMPWDASVSATWRHIAAVKNGSEGAELATPLSDAKLPSRNYFDLSASWSPIKPLNLRAGVNNIFDTEPPFVGVQTGGVGAANGNTYAQVYDALGRYVFLGATIEF